VKLAPKPLLTHSATVCAPEQTLEVAFHCPFVFIFLRIPFPANPFFSHPYKSLAGVGVFFLLGVHESPVTSHKSHVFNRLPPLWSLFPLFFNLPFFIFNSLQPLFPEHPGWGVRASRSPLRGPWALCVSAVVFSPFSPSRLAPRPSPYDLQLPTVAFPSTMLKSTRHCYDYR
jgi:hypothetical protein